MDLRYPIGKFEWKSPANEPEAARGREHYIGVLAQLPANFSDAVDGLSEQQLDTPYRPEGWTVRQLVHHVPDSHLNAYVRFKLALTEDQPQIKTYDEALWAKLPDSRVTQIATSLQLLASLHARWVDLLRSMMVSDFGRTLFHPERGILALDEMLGLYAWHSLHHTAHITALRDRMHWHRRAAASHNS